MELDLIEITKRKNMAMAFLARAKEYRKKERILFDEHY